MRIIKLLFTVALLFNSFLNYSQERPQVAKIKISGKKSANSSVLNSILKVNYKKQKYNIN